MTDETVDETVEDLAKDFESEMELFMKRGAITVLEGDPTRKTGAKKARDLIRELIDGLTEDQVSKVARFMSANLQEMLRTADENVSVHHLAYEAAVSFSAAYMLPELYDENDKPRYEPLPVTFDEPNAENLTLAE